MTRERIIQFFIPFILLLTILFDGQFSNLLLTLFKATIYPASHIFLILLIYVVLKNSYLYNVLVSLILGIIYDSYFIGIIGIGALVFPLIALFIYHIRVVVHTNRLTRLFTLIIVTTIFEIVSNLIVYLFGLGDLDLVGFITQTLAPTLVLNIILWYILQFPLERIFIQKNR
ncbi:rod shape-determining protein MreD [Streptococcaceae bacterium ESL0687]|nr:rod shape-determining protein MreD [Streptococcaceae bacterium ESL0687]